MHGLSHSSSEGKGPRGCVVQSGMPTLSYGVLGVHNFVGFLFVCFFLWLKSKDRWSLEILRGWPQAVDKAQRPADLHMQPAGLGCPLGCVPLLSRKVYKMRGFVCLFVFAKVESQWSVYPLWVCCVCRFYSQADMAQMPALALLFLSLVIWGRNISWNFLGPRYFIYEMQSRR